MLVAHHPPHCPSQVGKQFEDLVANGEVVGEEESDTPTERPDDEAGLIELELENAGEDATQDGIAEDRAAFVAARAR